MILISISFFFKKKKEQKEPQVEEQGDRKQNNSKQQLSIQHEKRFKSNFNLLTLTQSQPLCPCLLDFRFESPFDLVVSSATYPPPFQVGCIEVPLMAL
ncbi:unnamed protein product [Lathyrus sativus]|nr:unnamed protein product [Lathyrus sativus]